MRAYREGRAKSIAVFFHRATGGCHQLQRETEAAPGTSLFCTGQQTAKPQPLPRLIGENFQISFESGGHFFHLLEPPLVFAFGMDVGSVKCTNNFFPLRLQAV